MYQEALTGESFPQMLCLAPDRKITSQAMHYFR
jgi:hypothetical protein